MGSVSGHDRSHQRLDPDDVHDPCQIKLRGCDGVTIKVEDVAASGYTADRATVRQKKTGRPVRFELGEQTRQAVDDYLKVSKKRPGDFLFTGRGGTQRSMTTRQYAR